MLGRPLVPLVGRLFATDSGSGVAVPRRDLSPRSPDVGSDWSGASSVCEMRLLLRVPRPLGTLGVDARAFVLLLPVRDLKGRPLVLCVSEDAMSVK